MLAASLATVGDEEPTGVRLESSSSVDRGATGDDERAKSLRERSSRGSRSRSLFATAETTTTSITPPTTTSTSTPPTSTTSTTAKPTTTTVRPATTTTTVRPTTTTVRATTTPAAPATTTTTAAPATTSTMGAPPPCCREEGGASYHDYADPRTCAHKSLPKGTALKVTNLANGKVTTCVVNDRGPYVAGRIIDLSRTAFTEIASISDGVIRVAIEW